MGSKRLIASYTLDWILIIAIAAAGAGLNYVTPFKKPFSLLDLDISYPLVAEQISTATLIVVALVIPAVIIVAIVALLLPGPGHSKSMKRQRLLHLKLWELQAGWAGLALSIAAAFFITQGLKNLFGKPRPNMLARCQPDLNNIASHIVGGYGQTISDRWTLVTASICTSTDKATLNDGFRSFPSGHASASWSGLLYLSLFLGAKLGIRIPYLPYDHGNSALAGKDVGSELLPLQGSRDPYDRIDTSNRALAGGMPERNLAAAPPIYLVVLFFVPICVALYICSTRFVESYHFGFDIISGAIIGILSSYGAFRLYHSPSRGTGWAWGPRNRDGAFAVGPAPV